MKKTLTMAALAMAMFWAVAGSAAEVTTAPAGNLPPVSQQIMVDQFGFRPADEKVAIFASPQEGFNAGTKYAPPAKASVRRADTGEDVLTVELKSWGNGQTDKTSGDKVWQADISALKAPGTYYMYDPENRVRSYTFRIADDVYLPVLKAAVRAYFYQRCGGDLPAANGGTWNHPACHVGDKQDLTAELYTDGQAKGAPRDVHGGWHDAGDYNRYVPFTLDVVIPLLMAYESNPAAFGDDWNIPESGNGLPDILDEVGYECDWLLRMQLPDGSVCNRVTARGYKQGVSPEKDSATVRYYTQPTTWGTATFAADIACYARALAKFPKEAERVKALRAAAEKAWAFLEANPGMKPTDGSDHGRPSDAAGDAGCDGKAGDTDRRVLAAVQLWLMDPQAKYEDFFKKFHKDMSAPTWIQYALAPKADAALAGDVRAAIKKVSDDMVIGPRKAARDAYRAYMPGYWWGCNQSVSESGYRSVYAGKLGAGGAAEPEYRAAAEEYLHYLHGRNPLCFIFLTNMGPKGAKLSEANGAMCPFHYWFGAGTQWNGPSTLGPAPGLLEGGPNNGSGGAPDWLSPPAKQPPSKSFKDWAGNWNEAHHTTENSWAYTEPAIYYQARYVLLVAQFVGKD
jgi:hypothetical protein